MSWPGLTARVALQVLLFGILAPLLGIGRIVSAGLERRVTVLFHRAFLRLFDVRVEVRGTPPERDVPILVVANHVSWLDIPVLAGLLPLSFVAKSEVAGWPVFGFLARLQRCVFIDRSRKAATASANAALAERLAGGAGVVLFAEGTTGDGNRLMPFRSSLVGSVRNALAVSTHHSIRLQPLAIEYRTRYGLPLTRRERPAVAWYGDMDLLPHAAALLRDGPLDVRVTWGAPVPVGPTTDRKNATRMAEREVRIALRRDRSAILLAPRTD